METKTKFTIGGVMLLSIFLGTGLGLLINLDKPVWKCESKDLVSDCVNGVKACDGDICRRCYHNETNKKDYIYCKEGWIEFIEEIIEARSQGTRFSCTKDGCIKEE